MSKEYTYDIDKYTIGVDENGADEIGMTIAIIKNGEINFLGNCYGENARCIDLLIKENQELKKQLEDYKYSHSCSFVDTCKNVKIANFNQQKEFIEYMNETIEELECDDVDDEEMKGYLIQRIDTFKEILSKYKSIIGCDKSE